MSAPQGGVRLPAVILAGGTAKPDFIEATGVTNRALAVVNGATMLEHVVGALRESGIVESIALVGDLPAAPEYRSVADQGGFVENLLAGLEAAGDGHVLVCTADVPFLSGESIADFGTRALATGADIVYPFVELDACYARFPGMKRTAVTLREGKFTGGNAMLLNAPFVRSHRERLADVYAARKSPLKLAAMLGLGTVLRLIGTLTVAPGMLTVPQLERAVSRMLSGRAAGIQSSFPELATDVDRAEDFVALRAAGLAE